MWEASCVKEHVQGCLICQKMKCGAHGYDSQVAKSTYDIFPIHEKPTRMIMFVANVFSTVCL